MERERQQKVHDMKGIICLLISQSSIYFYLIGYAGIILADG